MLTDEAAASNGRQNVPIPIPILQKELDIVKKNFYQFPASKNSSISEEFIIVRGGPSTRAPRPNSEFQSSVLNSTHLDHFIVSLEKLEINEKVSSAAWF